MSNRVVISEAGLRQIFARAEAQAGRPVSCGAGVSQRGWWREWLLHDVTAQSAEQLRTPTCHHALVHFGSTPEELREALSTAPPEHLLAQGPVLVMALGRRRACGVVGAVAWSNTGAVPIERLRIVRPGLPEVALTESAGPVETSQPAIWSRSWGALGETTARRLQELSVAMVGCGRTGSLVAEMLVRAGVRRLVLIDSDRLEPHNLGEMTAVSAADLGKPKVEVVAEHLRRQALVPVRIDALDRSVLELASLHAIKEVDWLFSCVDSDTARLAATFLAAVYLKPLCDLGTGIFLADPSVTDRRLAVPPRQMGADVRLVLPGQCLVCLGGLADLPRACQELLNPPAHPPQTPQDWRRQRSGSLRSLNTLAAALAMRLLEDFLGGRLEGSTWLRVEYSETGIPQLQQRTPAAARDCPLCRLAGGGDDAVGQVRRLVENLRTAF